ncbi:MAG: phosphodiester glycosidase family protein, partial [Spirochaetaceae bacterium]|nr:phosphodiester glycosidase family protein [Spirochaetaceae bacterium]
EKGIIPRIATQSGPLLIQNGKIHQSFQKDSDNKFIRNGVALIEWETTELIVFVISDRPVNFYDFSKFLKDFFHCSSALYLDGHISAMYVPSLQRNQMGGSFGTMLYCTEP